MKKANWYALLALPFIGTLVPLAYNRLTPALLGVPFFYWYQLLWVVITAALLWLVIHLTAAGPDV